MNEDEFVEQCRRLMQFTCRNLGEFAGANSATGFLWAVWASMAFPEWWAQWQSALPHIEAIMGDALPGAAIEVQAELIDPQKEEDKEWHISTGLN